MARASQLEGRLLSILNPRAPRTQPARAMGLAAAVLAIALMAPLAAIRAQSQADQAIPADVEATILAANAQKNREILDQAAVTFERLRKFAEAKKLREASLSLAEQISGPQSAEYAMALVRLGDLARRYGTAAESDSFYQRALALGDRPEVFPALMRLALTSKDPEQRQSYLERARVASRNGNDAGTAMTWLAHDRQDEPDGAAYSDSMYRGAMALESPDSPALAMTLELYAEFLKATGRAAEATPVQDRAKALRKTLTRTAVSARLNPAVVGVKVGSGVTAPKLASKVEPEYSEEARSLKYQGTVTLKVVVDVDGLAKNIEVVNGLGYGLDEKAAQAIALWKFTPGTNADGPVPVLAMIEVNFRLM
jgi:TonB family protein